MADAKSRLSNLFQGTSGSTQGNDALRYQAPREPTRSSVVPSQTIPVSTPTNVVIYSTTVALYQYDGSNKKYTQVGTPSSNIIGCVLIGAEINYDILFYNSEKVTQVQLPIKTWKPIVQSKQYINFYDENKMNWSMKFTSEDQLVEFMKYVFLVQIHMEIWNSARTMDANALWMQDLGSSAIRSNENNSNGIQTGDTVGVTFQCWRVVGNAKSVPHEIVTKYPPFEKAMEMDSLRKFKVGEGTERLKVLEEGVIGMKRGGIRMILAPPGKTNGQDWHLLEVTLVKSKTGSSTSTSATPSSAPVERRSTTVKTRRKTTVDVNLVPYDEEKVPTEKRTPTLSPSEAMELKELRLLQRQQQLDQQTQVLQASQQQQAMYNGIGPINGGFSSMTTLSTRPVDGLIMDLHAKVDYLIRTSTSSSSGSMSGYSGVGATDVQAVLRGVERLAAENERLLSQIHSQNQQYVSYEKRCDELVKQNQRIQEEKKLVDEKYQIMVSLQTQHTAEMTNLANARDSAMTQMNRLHGEYQQLLTAFYQKQQGTADQDTIQYEQQTRLRVEKELEKQIQSCSLLEQELTLLKKQLAIVTRLKETEMNTFRQDMEMKLSQVEQNVMVQTTRVQEGVLEVERWKKEYQRVQQEMAGKENEWSRQFHELNTAKTTAEQAATMAQHRLEEQQKQQQSLADDEKLLYEEQIQVLQQQIQALEEEKRVRLQKEMEQMSLSPRSRPKLAIIEDQCRHCANVESQLAAAITKEQAAMEALKLAQSLKDQAQSAVQGNNTRDQVISLLKEAVNDMFFQFQEVFETTEVVDNTQVLQMIRKVLKQSTKEMVLKLQQEEKVEDEGPPPPPPQAEDEVVEKEVEDEKEEESDDLLFGEASLEKQGSKLAAFLETVPSSTTSTTNEASIPFVRRKASTSEEEDDFED